MKQSRICPKCNSNDIVRIDGVTGAYGSGNNVFLGTTVFSAVNVDRYICCHCGYAEEWIDRAYLDKVRGSKRAKR